MAKFKTITSSDITTSKSFLNQLVDVIQEDISGSTTRQKYQVFVTGGVGPGVTSSLFQTVYDQDFTLQTANPVFDMTVGTFRDYVGNGMPLDKTVTDDSAPTMAAVPVVDGTTGKLTFAQNSLMMREKINLYRQFAQLLKNDAGAQFTAPVNDSQPTDVINNALFVCYKRLFSRDSIKRETFATKFYSSAAYVPTNVDGTAGWDISVSTGGSTAAAGLYTYTDGTTVWVHGYADDGVDATSGPADGTWDTVTPANEEAEAYGWFETTGLPADLPEVTWPTGTAADKVSIIDDLSLPVGLTNLNTTSPNSVKIYTDVGSSTSKITDYAGAVGDIVDASDTNVTVGTIYYDHGIAVYDLEKIMDCTQKVSGTISSVSDEATDTLGTAGTVPSDDGFTVIGALAGTGPDHCNQDATFVPDLMYSGSVDNILDHIASCRFGSGTYSAMTFQNVTNINSSLIFCRSTADEFNFSSNSSYTDETGRIVVIDEGNIGEQSSFTFVTSVGLYDSSNQLLAVAKLSRPVEKNNEKDMTFRIRLDF
jgi:hypothetical protein